MKKNHLVLICFIALCEASVCLTSSDHDNVFNEELVLKELNNDFLYSYFQFTTRWNIKTRNDRKFAYFGKT
jgi:hypothetical protein